MKRIGLFLFFCILSLHGIAQVENDKDTLITRQDKINEFINEMNEADKSMDFINEPPTLTPVSYTHLDVYKRQDYGIAMERITESEG